MSNRIILIIMVILIIYLSACNTKQGIRVSRKAIPRKSAVAVIIDSPNNIKNVVLSEFMKKGFNVKAINATDLYAMNEIFDITDLKKMSYNSSGEGSLVSLERTYKNVYKLHLYNFEVNKAEILGEIKKKWNVDYLVILSLQDWGEISWGRAIELSSYDVIWIENYPTLYTDDLKSIVNHFIWSMARKR